LSKNCGMMVNEIICKPRIFSIARRSQYLQLRNEIPKTKDASPEIQESVND